MNWKHWMGSAALVCGAWMTLTTSTEAAPYEVQRDDQAIVGFYDWETKQTTPYPAGVSKYLVQQGTSYEKTLFLFRDEYNESENPYYLMDAKTGTSEQVDLPDHLHGVQIIDENHLVANSLHDYHVLTRQGSKFVISDTVTDDRSPSVRWLSPNRFSLHRAGLADWYDVQADGIFKKVRSVATTDFSPLTVDWIVDLSGAAVLKNVETNQTYPLPNARTQQSSQGAYETADGLYFQLSERDTSKKNMSSSSLYYFDKQTGQIRTLVDYSDNLARQVFHDGRVAYSVNGQITMMSFADYLRQPIAIDDLTADQTAFLEKTVIEPKIELTRIDGTKALLALRDLVFSGNIEQQQGNYVIPTSPKRINDASYSAAYTAESGLVFRTKTDYQYKRYLTADLKQLSEVKEGLYTYKLNIGQPDVWVTATRLDGTRLSSALSDADGLLTLPLSTTGLLGEKIKMTVGDDYFFDQAHTTEWTVKGYETPFLKKSTNNNFKTVTYQLESTVDGGTYTVYAGKKKLVTVPAKKMTTLTIPYANDLETYRIVRSGEYASKSLSLKGSTMISSTLSHSSLYDGITDEQTLIEGALDFDASYGKLYIDGKYTAYIDRKKTRIFAIKTKPLKVGQVVKLVARKGTQLQVSELRVVAAKNPTLKSYTTALSTRSQSWKMKATKGNTIVVTINKKRYTKVATGKTQTMTFPKQKRGTKVTVYAESVKHRKSKTFTLTVK
ncbi:hypothetical protein [Exiguobacterium sp. s193]|uniref:hypothetical protein n=1 Tax=Exiguobacterium sp. s193 TaxID=2751207 RepID=UPI001BEA33CF|nr:hypothetical protein [Exiguobacterium sp. s193]